MISPVLSNLFLHYVFDKWMHRHHPDAPWCRYADDGLVHCRTEQQAQDLLCELRERFAECGLELHPQKTKIVYCKDGNRRGRYHTTSFDLARECNPILQGWLNDYGKYRKSAMYAVCRHFNMTLVAWAMKK